MTKSQVLKYWVNVRKLTMKIFDLFPENKFDFRPTVDVRTVAEQFDHILVCELFTRIGIITHDWSLAPFLGERDLSRRKLRNKLYEEHEKTIGMLKLLPEGQLMKVYDTPFGDITGEVAILVGIDEEIHHRANLYTYLRILGIEPPQMVHNYGNIFLEEYNEL